MDKNKKIIIGIIILIIALFCISGITSTMNNTSSTTSSPNSNHSMGNDSQNSVFAKEFNSESTITYKMGTKLDYDYVENHFVKENMEIKKLDPSFAGSSIGAGIETKDYYAFALMLNGKYSGDIIYEKSTGIVKTIT
ncbi:MAG: hypothetical protein ACRC1M_00485 [Methanobacteriaceae archaeon]